MQSDNTFEPQRALSLSLPYVPTEADKFLYGASDPSTHFDSKEHRVLNERKRERSFSEERQPRTPKSSPPPKFPSEPLRFPGSAKTVESPQSILKKGRVLKRQQRSHSDLPGFLAENEGQGGPKAKRVRWSEDVRGGEDEEPIELEQVHSNGEGPEEEGDGGEDFGLQRTFSFFGSYTEASSAQPSQSPHPDATAEKARV